ncbi:MAG TPA: fibronectin type III domain-containing protein [Streptosporangiaceae bacterium]
MTATPGNGTSSLSWTAPSSNGGANITGYQVFRGTAAGGEGSTPIAAVTGTSYTDTGLTDGTQYYYTVEAVNSVGNSGASNEASDTPVASVPSAPQKLAATGGAGQVALSWQAPSSSGGSSITGYDVYRGTASGQESLVASDVSGTFYTDTGLGQGTQYFYTVAAVNSAGVSAMSSEANATTNAPTAEPTAPQNLSATPGTGSVALNWQVPSSDGGSAITGYNVYRGTSSGTETLLASNVSGTSYTDSAVANLTQYFYEVTAVNANGESGDSNEVSATSAGSGGATVPGAPTGFTATPGNGQAVLNWAAPTSDGGSPIIGYDVYRSTTSGGELAIGSTDANTTSFTDGNLTNDTTYYYEVTAVNGMGQSVNSSEVSVTPASDGSGTFTGSLTNFHSTEYTVTPTGSSLSANLSWTGDNEQLSIYDSSGTEIGHTQTGSSPLSDTVTVTPGQTYNVKVKDFGSGNTDYTITISG